MTIKEFAKNQGVTTQAVYQRIKAAGLKLSDIKKDNSPELTAEGLESLTNIFLKNDNSGGAKIAEYKSTITKLQVENENLKTELEKAKKTAEKEKENCEHWMQQAEFWAKIAEKEQQTALNAQKIASKIHESLQEAQRTAQQAQALQMASIQALKQPPRLSLWQRLTGKREKIPAEAVKTAAEVEDKTE